MIHPLADVEDRDSIHDSTKVWRFTHVRRGAIVGHDVMIGQGCYVDGGARIGDGCHIQNGVYLWRGVCLEDDVFVGPNVTFTNVRRPRAGMSQAHVRTLVGYRASLGANCTIICGLVIGERAMVAAGAVVTKSVPAGKLVAGIPARVVGDADGF